MDGQDQKPKKTPAKNPIQDKAVSLPHGSNLTAKYPINSAALLRHGLNQSLLNVTVFNQSKKEVCVKMQISQEGEIQVILTEGGLILQPDNEFIRKDLA